MLCKKSAHTFLCFDCRSTITYSFITRNQHEFNHVYLSPYSSPLRSLIHHVKFNHNLEAIEFLKGKLKNIDKRYFSEIDYWIPIPYHNNRLQERGFNFLNLLFHDFFLSCGLCRLDLFIRSKNTKPLHNLTISERKAELSNAFEYGFDVHFLKGKSVVLVDDILTTGTTVSYLINLLKCLGCKDVKVFTLTHVEL